MVKRKSQWQRERERERGREREKGSKVKREMRVLATLASIYSSECSSFRFMFVINRVSGSHTRTLSLSLSLTHTHTRTHAPAHSLTHARTHTLLIGSFHKIIWWKKKFLDQRFFIFSHTLKNWKRQEINVRPEY